MPTRRHPAPPPGPVLLPTRETPYDHRIRRRAAHPPPPLGARDPQARARRRRLARLPDDLAAHPAARHRRPPLPPARHDRARPARRRAQRPRVLAQRRPHDDHLGHRTAHRDPRRGRHRHGRRPRSLPAPPDAHDGRVPAPHPLGRAHPARDPHVRVPDARGAAHRRVRKLLAGVRAGAVRRRGRRHRRPRHRPQLRAHPGVPLPQPRAADRAALHHDRRAPRRRGRPHPHRHGGAAHRRARHRPRHRLRPQRGRRAHRVRLRRRRGAARPAREHAVPRDRAARALVAPVGARGGGLVSSNMMTRSIAVLRRPAGRSRSILSSIWFALGFPFFLLVLWGVWATIAPQKFFPSPIAIVEAFVKTWIGPAFVDDVLPSLARLAIGIVVSILVGVVAGTVIGLVRWLRELLEPTLEFFRAVPPPVLVPILMLVFGPGDATRVIVILAGAVWPVLLNTIEGVRSTDSVMTETARSFALTPLERLRYLVLPSASPRIMTGVRQSLSVALILMVISEMFNNSSGLGYRITYFQ